MQAGIPPPTSQERSRSTTPLGSLPTGSNNSTVASTESYATVIDLRSAPALAVPESRAMTQATPSMASSHLSSALSEEDNGGQCIVSRFALSHSKRISSLWIFSQLTVFWICLDAF